MHSYVSLCVCVCVCVCVCELLTGDGILLYTYTLVDMYGMMSVYIGV